MKQATAIDAAVRLLAREDLPAILPYLDQLPSFSRKAVLYAQGFFSSGAKTYIQNAETQLKLIRVDDIILPLTINDGFNGSCYVCSSFNQYVTYAEEEALRVRPAWLGKILAAITTALGSYLKRANVDRAVMVNNWLLSTNLYPALSDDQILRLRDFLMSEFPTHAIVFRSVDEHPRAALAERFRRLGFRMVVSRQVYVLDPHKDFDAKNRSLQRDRNLTKRFPLEYRRPESFQAADAAAIVDLYNQLYLKKYSINNPQFTEAFVEHCRQNGILQLHGWAENGRLVAMFGYQEQHGMMTSPLFGYDFRAPYQWGLYRQLMHAQLQVAREKGLLLHLSSGAAEFKRMRGAQPYIEYLAVAIPPGAPRRPWVLLGALSKWIAIPLLRKLKL